MGMHEVLIKSIAGAKNFYWKEALYHSQWDCYVLPPPEVYRNILIMAKVMEKIRDILGRPIRVTSWYRSPIYNHTHGGSMNSYHMSGRAVDFYPMGLEIKHCRDRLKHHLASLDIRMEQDTDTWLHIDNGVPGETGRFFKP